MKTPLSIQNLKQVAIGNFRTVYEHPEDRNLLIKVVRPEVCEKRWGSGAPWLDRRRRLKQYTLFFREINEYLATCASTGTPPSFAQKITGLIETDLGIGLVTEAVLGRDGDLAPTLRMMIAEGRFHEQEEAALQRCVDALVESDLVIADLHPGHFVYAHSEDEGDYFVLIDGIGSTTAIPMKIWFRRVNLKSKRSKVKKLYRRIAKERMKRAKSLDVGIE
jgi:hypothetical protein